MIRILHIGDFHYKPNKNNHEQKQIVEKLIKHLTNKPQIDYVFFSGDLVHSGVEKKDFNDAHDLLFEPLIKELNISVDNIFVSPGNHDINRVECSEAIINFYDEKIKSNEELNNFYKTADKDYKSSLTPSDNYYNYFLEKLGSSSIEHNNLYSIYKKELKGQKLGVLILNSAWLSSGERDAKKLLFPTVIIKDAIQKLKDSNIKIVMVHHPLSDLRDYNYTEVQDLIHKEFNFLLSGHIHREQIGAQFNADNGIYCNTTQATLSFDIGSEIGYSVINLDVLDNSVIKLDRATYLKKENSFVDLESVVVNVPCGEEKNKQNKLRQKITSKYDTELNNANQLLLNYDEGESKNFVELFTAPILSKKTDAQSSSTDNDTPIDCEALIHSELNYLIFGKDKYGKTSLLKKLQLNLLKKFGVEGLIPLYIDYKEQEIKGAKFNISRYMANYYEINNGDAEKIIKRGRLVLLVDNFDPASEINSLVVTFLEENSNVQFIICSDYVTTRIFEEIDNLSYEKLFLKGLSRKQIRLYAEKMPNVKKEDRETALEKITLLCSQIQLPINYWTISLLLLIYKNSNEDYGKNLFGVMDLCVDEILKKKQLQQKKGKLTFQQYKEICSMLSHHLLINYRERIYSAEYQDIINFFVECKNKNPRLGSEPNEIFDFLYSSGILKMKGNRYTFRLNGLFEYFLAFYLKENDSFKKEILENDAIYLAFKNELEIYSGFNNKDEEFLNNIFNKTKSVFDPIIGKYKGIGTLDENLTTKTGEVTDFVKTVKKLLVSKPLSHELQDALRDQLTPLETESEVHIKEPVDINKIDYELLEKYIAILSRVFKNSDGIVNINLINSIFDYILESYCCLGFCLIEEVKTYIKDENLKPNVELNDDSIIGEELLKMVSRIMPVLMQVNLHDGVGHPNLKNVIHQKIELLKKDAKKNQYKLFLLYFLLTDTNYKENREVIDDVFEYVTLPVLKVSTYFKLNFYLAFKAYNNKNTENDLIGKVKHAQFRLDSGVDKDDFNRELSKTGKRNILKSVDENRSGLD